MSTCIRGAWSKRTERALAGPVLGAVVVEIVSEALRAYGQIRMVLFALVVLGMMRLYPLGLVGVARAALAGGPAAWRFFRARIRPPLLSQNTAGARPR